MLQQLVQKLRISNAKLRIPLLGLGVAITAAILLFLILRGLFPPKPTLLEQGRQLYAEGHYTQAVTVLRQQILANPQDFDSKLLIAQNFVALQQWQPAQGYLREYLLQQGETPSALYWVAVAQVGDKKLDLAEKNFRRLIALNDPTYKARARLGLAEMYYQQANFNEAGAILYEALSLGSPLDPLEEQRANYLYAVLLTRDTRFEDATVQFKRALKVKARSYWVDNAPVQWQMAQNIERINLILARLPDKPLDRQEAVNRTRAAYALLTIDEFAPAEENLNRVLALVPTYYDGRAYLGSIYWRTGRITEARATFNSVIKQDPQNRLARQFMVQLLNEQLQTTPPENTTTDQSQQDIAYAQSLLSGLLKERPDDPLLWMDQARLHIVRGEYDQALKDYEQAIKYNQAKPNPNLNPEAQVVRVFNELGVEPCRMGLSNSDRLIKDTPSDADSWFTAGLNQLVCLNPDKAIEYFQRAMAIRPNWPDAAYRLSQAYTQKNNKVEAEKWYNLAADVEPRRRWAK